MCCTDCFSVLVHCHGKTRLARWGLTRVEADDLVETFNSLSGCMECRAEVQPTERATEQASSESRAV